MHLPCLASVTRKCSSSWLWPWSSSGRNGLPELAGQVGRWVRDFRRMSSDLTGEFEKTFAEVDEVKKSFTRELQGIQEEVEGIGKSTRGDSEEVRRQGHWRREEVVGPHRQEGNGRRYDSVEPGAVDFVEQDQFRGEGCRLPMARVAKNGPAGKLGGIASETRPVATKTDPLADVSFFDLDADVPAAKNGSSASTNGVAGDDAVSRVRRRRAASAYAQRNSA